MNKSVLLWFKQIISVSWNRNQTGVGVQDFCQNSIAGAGAEVKLFRAGVQSESKNLDSDHLCYILWNIKAIIKLQSGLRHKGKLKFIVHTVISVSISIIKRQHYTFVFKALTAVHSYKKG